LKIATEFLEQQLLILLPMYTDRGKTPQQVPNKLLQSFPLFFKTEMIQLWRETKS
jgi:hypothetical protein